MYRFTITLDKDGCRGRFYSPNNQLVWWTEGYDTRDSALHAIALLRQHAASAPLV